MMPVHLSRLTWLVLPLVLGCAKDRSGEVETEIADTPDTVESDGDDTASEPDAGPDADDGVNGDGDVDAAADVEVDGSDACTPDCAGRACGTDGCGGSCGSCGDDKQCDPLGACVVVGCVPDCFGRVCGPDDCGGSCGSCAGLTPFCDDGACVAACVPDCAQRACGDDGCGGSCGVCAGGAECSLFGTCVATGWTCAATLYEDGARCDCECGAPDPDCDRASAPVVGCAPFDACVAASCTPEIPLAWTCDALSYGDGVRCDCACGAVDPDCGDRDLATVGCGVGESCGNDGTCVACVPDCGGRTCGNDGCGGSCGACPDADPDTGLGQQACVDGACVDGCTPTPALCASNECGDDGCGGSCGTCPNDTTCVRGRCQIDPGMSCQGACGIAAPGGCGCDRACIGNNDCCPDFLDQCYCLGNCAGRECGDDGCGGTCGTCTDPGALFCDGDGQCGATCTPSCVDKACGDDGCGGSCGQCDAGATCNDRQRCVPAAWSCAPFMFGDGEACDCSCGAPDPDCETIGLTFNCPLDASCVAATGVCDLAFCGADSQCSGIQRCQGHYLASGGARLGVCAPQLANGRPDGFACATDAGCASEVCAGGICRGHCQAAGDCGSDEVCVAVPVVDAIAGEPQGLVSVCDGLFATPRACAKQSDCSDGACLALAHPTTFQPIYRCGTGDAAADLGAACDPTQPCSLGLVCADATCVLACPGGGVDCPAGSTCTAVLLHGGASTLVNDDVLVPACVAR